MRVNTFSCLVTSWGRSSTPADPSCWAISELVDVNLVVLALVSSRLPMLANISLMHLGRPSFADDLLLLPLCQIAVPFRKSSTPGGFDSTPPTPLLLIATIVSNPCPSPTTEIRWWLGPWSKRFEKLTRRALDYQSSEVRLEPGAQASLHR